MTPLLDRSFEITLETLTAEFRQQPGATLEAWVFAPLDARAAAEALLREAGVTARIRSAFKPLLHAFLEDLDLAGAAKVRIAYPVQPGAPANRFLLEAYPLAALLPAAEVSFAAGTETPLTYEITITRADGGIEEHRVFAPNREHSDPVGEPQLSPTGWVRATDGSGKSRDERIETDIERLFETAVATVAVTEWSEAQPYFGQLHITATLPCPDHDLGFGDEAVRLAEALHEDLYFSLLELFQIKSGLPLGNRTLRAGQIVPEITCADGPPHLRIEVLTLGDADADTADTDAADQPLDAPLAPLPPRQIAAELAKVGGDAFSARSAAGREVLACYRGGGDAAVMISGGQHANEPSGIVGALLAAQALAARPEAHFSVAPLENPDGYALYRELATRCPGQMLHGARYTALGDDLEYRIGEPRFEAAIRDRARAITAANFHINLHGYPAHEWSRPFTGYVPRGFAMWMLPRGYFFILRHHAAWAGAAERMIDKITRRVAAAVPEVLELTARQRRMHALHAGNDTGMRVINGFCCQVAVDDTLPTPLKLTTEYPDESLRGQAFALACQAQAEATLAAYDAYQKIVG